MSTYFIAQMSHFGLIVQFVSKIVFQNWLTDINNTNFKFNCIQLIWEKNKISNEKRVDKRKNIHAK